MNYDEQHERVTQDLGDSLNQQQKFQERLEKIIEMREAGKTLQEIGDAVGVTRQRVEQLLKPTGVVAPYHAEREARRQAVAEWARCNPIMSCEAGGQALGINVETVRHDLKVLGIKRDISAVCSASAVRAKLRGRVELTRELLEREYLTNNLSTNDIARKYNYRQGGVMRRLNLYGIHKDKSLVYAQISKKRSGQKLVDGRYI